MSEVGCAIAGCEKGGPFTRSWCGMHYQRWRIHGDPHKTNRHHTPEESYAARTVRQGKCLVWTGSICSGGYGQIGIRGRMTLVHRYAWEREFGPIPEGWEVDHRCHNRACSELSHLRIVTHKQNMENPSGPMSTNTSGYPNVSWNRVRGKYQVLVVHHGKKYSGGYFPKEDVDKAGDVAVALKNRLFTHNDRDRT